MDYKFNLQLFAEGEGAGVSAVPAANGEGAPAPNNEQATDAQVQAEERKKAYEAAKAQFKDEYDADVQSIVKDRLKTSKAKNADLTGKLKTLDPILQKLASKYGVDAADISAIAKAYEEDDSNFEDEAYERGMTVEQLRYERQLEARSRELAAIEEEKAKEEQYRIWDAQVAETQRYYPGFDIGLEMQNEAFASLMRSGVPIKTAFEVVHHQEMMQGAMQFAAQRATNEVSNKVKSNLSRPVENGTNAQAASVAGYNPSAMSLEQLEEIARRVKAGEQINLK